MIPRTIGRHRDGWKPRHTGWHIEDQLDVPYSPSNCLKKQGFNDGGEFCNIDLGENSTPMTDGLRHFAGRCSRFVVALWHKRMIGGEAVAMALWRVLLPGGIQRPLGRQEGPAMLVSVVDTSYECLLSGNLSCAPLGTCGSKILYQGPPVPQYGVLGLRVAERFFRRVLHRPCPVFAKAGSNSHHALFRSSEALRTALKMWAYVPQRHRLPHIPSRISSMLGLGFFRSRPSAAITCPGVQ